MWIITKRECQAERKVESCGFKILEIRHWVDPHKILYSVRLSTIRITSVFVPMSCHDPGS